MPELIKSLESLSLSSPAGQVAIDEIRRLREENERLLLANRNSVNMLNQVNNALREADEQVAQLKLRLSRQCLDIQDWFENHACKHPSASMSESCLWASRQVGVYAKEAGLMPGAGDSTAADIACEGGYPSPPVGDASTS